MSAMENLLKKSGYSEKAIDLYINKDKRGGCKFFIYRSLW
jgi:hypothetical protein